MNPSLTVNEAKKRAKAKAKRDRRKARGKATILNFKKGKACRDCKVAYPPKELLLVRPEKGMRSLRNMLCQSPGTILAVCQASHILCRACNRRRLTLWVRKTA